MITDRLDHVPCASSTWCTVQKGCCVEYRTGRGRDVAYAAAAAALALSVGTGGAATVVAVLPTTAFAAGIALA
jgi:hypothetical protein